MTLDERQRTRLQFLVRVTQRECEHLRATDARLFAVPFTTQRVAALAERPDEAERVDAFVGRFGRLQDTLGNKLLPTYLAALGEEIGAVIETLDRAERLGFIPSADDWLAIRKLRNQMVHEYLEDAVVLAGALQAGHEFVPTLIRVAEGLVEGIRRRGWLDRSADTDAAHTPSPTRSSARADRSP